MYLKKYYYYNIQFNEVVKGLTINDELLLKATKVCFAKMRVVTL
jgi:hypothetical protein